MMLRVSSMQEGVDIDLKSVVASDAASGLPHGRILNAYVEAVLGDDETALAAARDALRADMGDAALVDCAGVVATFMQMDRLADGAGIVQPRVDVEQIRELTRTLGLDRFPSAGNTPGVHD